MEKFIRAGWNGGHDLVEEEWQDRKVEMHVCKIEVKNCIFRRVTFLKSSFLDRIDFQNCLFEDCNFDGIDMRWVHFKKCTFKGCTGTINWFYGVRFYNGCEYSDTKISIKTPDNSFGIFCLYKKVRRAPKYIGE